MVLLAFGINHRTASVDVREKVAFAPDCVVDALLQARDATGLSEVAILSTCNRTEVYGACDEKSSHRLIEWMVKYHRLQSGSLRDSAYEFWEKAAVTHMMRVASGLDSMVLGEPQILGQLKTAYQVAQDAKTIGPALGRLFQQSFSVAKKVRTDTGIGTNPVSVAFAAVSLAKHIFSDLSQNTALLIGAGETVELVARHLHEQGVNQILVANRTLGRANSLAEMFNGKAITLQEIPDVLHKADIVISSTASPLPILGKGAVEHALKRRKHRPMFMMDIAVPRDIEEEVAELADVYLYTVDDLQQVVDENRKQREQAAIVAEEIVDQQSQAFMDSLRGLDAVATIRAYRGVVEGIREQELAKALEAIERGEDAKAVLQRMSRALANKVLHEPTVQLKKAGEEGQVEKLQWAETLFGVSATSADNQADKAPDHH
ncbi:MAG: glutamyl-tRNA reductase [Gammaproteobacteria bacterium]|nr:MAG: glutamyl-tRNA reductase [Gammaproteobacteria bacterium]